MWRIASNEWTGIPFPVRYAENMQTITVSGRPGHGRPAPRRPGRRELSSGRGGGVLGMPAARRTLPGGPGREPGVTPALGTGPARSPRDLRSLGRRLLAFCPVIALMSGLLQSRLWETGEP